MKIFSGLPWTDIAFLASCNSCNQQLFPNSSGNSEIEADPPENLARHWCPDCLRNITGAPLPSCESCGAYLSGNNPFGDKCKLCFRLDLKFLTCTAIGNYQGLLQHLVLQMKREKSEILAIQFGQLLGEQLRPFALNLELDEVIPVPIHWRRKLIRGFHGAGLIAEGTARSLERPLRRRGLVANRLTKKQATLSLSARFKNVKGAFHANPKFDLEGKNILLVDDVMTSGASASSAAKAILKAGAKSVHVGIVARGARVS